MKSKDKNVLGTELKICSELPLTGFYRDGFCRSGYEDKGSHVIAAIMTDRFLAYTLSVGNDLISPNPLFGFPGLKKGDRWCLCAVRWQEANKAGCAPLVDLEATNEKALKYVKLQDLLNNSIKVDKN